MTIPDGTAAVAAVVRVASMPIKNMPPPRNAVIRKVVIRAGVVFFMVFSFSF